jgi:hypothetical protein
VNAPVEVLAGFDGFVPMVVSGTGMAAAAVAELLARLGSVAVLEPLKVAPRSPARIAVPVAVTVTTPQMSTLPMVHV